MAQTDIWAPVLYVTILIGALYAFSYIYRKRVASQRQFEPWYPTHPERDLYIFLLQKVDSPAPDHLIKAALLRRAAADVARIVRIREDKQALQVLLQKGSVGDDLWNSCLTAEKELEAEILEVMGEANTFRPGWGQFIFASASEILGHDKIKDAVASIPRVRAEAEAKYRSKRPQVTVQNPASAEQQIPASNPPGATLKPPASPLNGSAHLSDADSADSAGSPTTSRKSASKKGKKRK